MKKIAVLIPCYNESKTIQKVVADYRTALPEADIYVCSDEGLTLTAYKDTDNYQVTKSFLQDPKRYLRFLLED